MLIILLYILKGFLTVGSRGEVAANLTKLAGSTRVDPREVSDILKNFQVGYDRRVRPFYGQLPVQVAVSLYVLSIGEISEKFMDFTFDMYFRQLWKDDRLQFQKKPGLDQLIVGADYIKLIWVPDTFFVNEKVASFHQATQDNQFLRITYLGEILRSMRLTVKATCPMDLTYFPMDSQLCTLEIESYGYTMTDLIYVWDPKSVQVSPTVSLPEFFVVGYRKRRVLETLSSGNYSRLCADILFTRSMGYYIIQVYIPSSMIVCMSWVSFYLDRGSAPARVGLGVTTVLTMVTLMGAVNRSLPKISYMKALDIYLAVCFFMVFGALLEYAIVSYTGKRIILHQRQFAEFKKKVEEMKQEFAKEREKEEQLVKIEEDSDWDLHSEFCPHKLQYEKHKGKDLFLPLAASTASSSLPTTRPIPSVSLADLQPPTTILGVRASDIERYARVAFPIVFLTFHMFYWFVLISISNMDVENLIPLTPD